jgi:AraC family transcriptional regulator
MDKSLVIDCTKKDSSLLVLPFNPILSSHKANWNKIQIESYSLHAHEVPEHLAEQHVVIVNEFSRLERWLLGNKVKDVRVKARDVVVVPAKTSHSASWVKNTSFTVLTIEPKFLARIAHEFISPDRVEILPCFAQPDPVIYEIVSKLKSKLELDQEVDHMYVDSATTFLATHLIEHYSVSKNHIKEKTNSLSHRELRRVIDYIDAHFDRNMGLKELANLVEMSHYHFARLFKRSTGISPGQYLVQYRLDKATHLMVSTKLSLDEIARQTGFSTHSYLSRMFRKYRAISPDQYRKEIRQ